MNYISLGYFCSIALDLEKFGLRNASFPFDWLISDFEGVESKIINIYNMQKDEGDLVAHSSLEKNPDIHKMFSYAIEPNKEQNLRRYKKRNRLIVRILKRVKRQYKEITGKEYIHVRQYI